MKISTRGRYALRTIIDIARHDSDEYIRLKDIAKRQQISEKYLESVVKFLVDNKMLEGKRGKNGGYRLAKPSDKITAWDVISVTEEGDLAPVACLEKYAEPCPLKKTCPTLAMWKQFAKTEQEFFKGYTIRELADK